MVWCRRYVQLFLYMESLWIVIVLLVRLFPKMLKEMFLFQGFFIWTCLSRLVASKHCVTESMSVFHANLENAIQYNCDDKKPVCHTGYYNIGPNYTLNV